MTFFCHRLQILNFPPYFASFSIFPPVIGENYYFPPTFTNFPPCFRKIHQLFTYFVCIFSPPTLTMMHLCITQCTYWTPLHPPTQAEVNKIKLHLPYSWLPIEVFNCLKSRC